MSMRSQLIKINNTQWSSEKEAFRMFVNSYSELESMHYILNKSLLVLKRDYGVFINDLKWRTENKDSLIRYTKNLMKLVFEVIEVHPNKLLESYIAYNDSKINTSSSCAPRNSRLTSSAVAVSVLIPFLWFTYLIHTAITNKEGIGFWRVSFSIVTLVPISLCLFTYFKGKKNVSARSTLFHSNYDSIDEDELDNFYREISKSAVESLLEEYGVNDRHYILP